MNIQDEVNQVVIHELIHAYDDCRAANLDWTNCAHHACSEVCFAETTSYFQHCICVTCLIVSRLLFFTYSFKTDSLWSSKW